MGRTARVALVGELNPLSLDPRLDLYPGPPSSSGARLQKILGLRTRSYLRLARYNLCHGSWSPTEAATNVSRIISNQDLEVLVLCGRKVGSLFNLNEEFFTRVRRKHQDMVLIPHPSGRDRIWNNSAWVEVTRNLLRECAPEIAWGENG